MHILLLRTKNFPSMFSQFWKCRLREQTFENLQGGRPPIPFVPTPCDLTHQQNTTLASMLQSDIEQDNIMLSLHSCNKLDIIPFNKLYLASLVYYLE